jgi:hypothetical protein
MAQGGEGISGNAIKWRKTNVNVPFSPFSGNFKMFLNIFGPIIMALLLSMEEEMGALGEKRQTLKWNSSDFSTFTVQDTSFSLPIAGKKNYNILLSNLGFSRKGC